jgi:hypothetical protein
VEQAYGMLALRGLGASHLVGSVGDRGHFLFGIWGAFLNDACTAACWDVGVSKPSTGKPR